MKFERLKPQFLYFYPNGLNETWGTKSQFQFWSTKSAIKPKVKFP